MLFLSNVYPRSAYNPPSFYPILVSIDKINESLPGLLALTHQYWFFRAVFSPPPPDCPFYSYGGHKYWTHLPRELGELCFS